MDAIGAKGRAILFVQRFWQPTSACLTCMPGSLMKLTSFAHWQIALQTGLGTGLLVLLLTFLPMRAVFRHRVGNALVVALLTMMGDAYSHSCHDGIRWSEVVLTGITSGLFALTAAVLFEDRARRLRYLWAASRGG
jgi:hypothetical protein